MKNWLLMQTLYHGLTNSTPENMDATAGGAFLSLTIAQATALIEKMASNQGWNEERLQTRKRGGGMHQLKEVDMMSAKWTCSWRSSKTELMRSKKSCTFMIPAWCLKSVETLRIQGTTVLKPMRMWTSSTTTFILNRIKDGISNRGQTTKVITKVTINVINLIISITKHLWKI